MRKQVSLADRDTQKGTPIPKEGAPTCYFCRIFSENCMKMKEFGARGARIPSDSDNRMSLKKDNFKEFLTLQSINTLGHVSNDQ